MPSRSIRKCSLPFDVRLWTHPRRVTVWPTCSPRYSIVVTGAVMDGAGRFSNSLGEQFVRPAQGDIGDGAAGEAHRALPSQGFGLDRMIDQTLAPYRKVARREHA